MTPWHLGIYPVSIYVITKQKQLNKLCKRHEIKDNPEMKIDGCAAAVFNLGEIEGQLELALYIPHDLKDGSIANVASLISHECTHIVQSVWNHTCENEPGDEAEAYLLGYLVYHFMDIIYPDNEGKKVGTPK